MAAQALTQAGDVRCALQAHTSQARLMHLHAVPNSNPDGASNSRSLATFERAMAGLTPGCHPTDDAYSFTTAETALWWTAESRADCSPPSLHLIGSSLQQPGEMLGRARQQQHYQLCMRACVHATLSL